MAGGLGPQWERRITRFRQDLRVFRRIFPWRTTAALLVAIGVMAWLFQIIYRRDLNEPLTFIQAVYAVLNMIFFQLAYTDVPADLNLTPFFVLVPIIGLSLFSLAGFNLLQVLRVFFVRRERGQRWQEALAATYGDHTVVCGLGSIGYRVAMQLAHLGQPLVGVELVETELVDQLIDADLPVILGNVRSRDVLLKAGVARAATVIVCTDQDTANIEAALHAREMNPGARLVLRIFDDEIAQSVRDGIDTEAVLSRSAISAVAFAHAAVGVRVLESFHLDERSYVLARVPLAAGSPLIGCTVGQVARARDATVAFLYRDGAMINEPDAGIPLKAGDDLFVFVDAERLAGLVSQDGHGAINDEAVGAPDMGEGERILVCGLGHLGYRVASILSEMGCRVTALERDASRLGGRLVENGVQVRVADFRRRIVLADAGVVTASAIVVCADDDMLNLETALRARELNPAIRIVLRIFEEELGRHLRAAFGIDAVYSTSALASPAFVGAALGMHLAQAVTIGDETLMLVRLAITPESGLIGQTVHALHADPALTLVLHARGDRLDVPPRLELPLCAGDELVILASPQRLRDLQGLNQSALASRGAGQVAFGAGQ
jgi:Trk K+ transport system NAD-binding subunit